MEARSRKLNWKQACEVLNCSRSHFYNLINSGAIPACRHGVVRGVWVYEADCKAYLQRDYAPEAGQMR